MHTLVCFGNCVKFDTLLFFNRVLAWGRGRLYIAIEVLDILDMGAEKYVHISMYLRETCVQTMIIMYECTYVCSYRRIYGIIIMYV